MNKTAKNAGVQHNGDPQVVSTRKVSVISFVRRNNMGWINLAFKKE